MPTSTSRLSYTDCFDYFEQALADPKGLVVTFEFSGDARHFRLRMHAARVLDRRENAETYEQGHPLFGRSMFDEIILRLREGKEGTHVILEKSSAKVLDVRSLSEVVLPEDLVEPEAEPAKPKEVVTLTDRRF